MQYDILVISLLERFLPIYGWQNLKTYSRERASLGYPDWHLSKTAVINNTQKQVDDIAQAYRVDSPSDVESDNFTQTRGSSFALAQELPW